MASIETRTTPVHLVRKKAVNVVLLHLMRKLVMTLDLFLVMLKGVWPALVMLETKQTTKSGSSGS